MFFTILGEYVRTVLRGRLLGLLSLELGLSIAVGVAVYFMQYAPPGRYDSATLPLAEFTKVLGTYGALGMGTCLTTLTLAARWTNADFIDYFRENTSNSGKYGSYSSFLFQLSWAAIVHWLALLVGLMGTLFSPATWSLVPRNAGTIGESCCGPAVCFLFTYCIVNFLSVLLGVSCLCFLRKEYMDNADRGG